MSRLNVFSAKSGKLLNFFSAADHGSRFVNMGITIDNGAIITMNKKNEAALIKIFRTDELADINFITKSAHWYQLCYLLNSITNITTKVLLQNVKRLIKGMIGNYSKI